jgi:hypothetical protein
MPDEFFIGWLPLPESYSRLLRFVVPLVLLLVILVAAALPLWQQSPGGGAWEADSVVTIEGVIQAEPYALLRTFATEDNSIRTLLLVEEGKFGAHERALPLAGQYVQATGTFLHKGDRWMLELQSQPDSLVAVPAPPLPDLQRLATVKTEAVGHVVLQGEIIDPKCYLGAMKPGGGKTHKACAMLCISGGIPPMLITRDPAGRETFYLLTDPKEASAKDCILNYVGDPVELAGQLELRDDLHVLLIDPTTVRRL